MAAAGVDGHARRLAGRRGRHTFGGCVFRTLVAAVVGDATAKPKRKAALGLNEQTNQGASKQTKALVRPFAGLSIVMAP